MSSSTVNKDTTIVYGADWCPDCLRAKSLLREAGIKFKYEEEDCRKNAESACGNGKIPCIVFPDGSTLSEPKTPALMEKINNLFSK